MQSLSELIFLSYQSLISSQLRAVDPISNNEEKQSETKDSGENEESSDYQEDLYPNNSEDFNLLYLNSAVSDWGQAQNHSSSKRKRT